MQVTNVDVKKVSSSSNSFLGYASVEFDGILVSKGWKIFKGKEGYKYSLGFPSEKAKEGTTDENGKPKLYWNNIFIDMKQESGKELIRSIENAVFSKYENGGGQPALKNQNQGFSDEAPF
jgi:DNA-binding cell septation regulator SpoVG